MNVHYCSNGKKIFFKKLVERGAVAPGNWILRMAEPRLLAWVVSVSWLLLTSSLPPSS